MSSCHADGPPGHETSLLAGQVELQVELQVGLQALVNLLCKIQY